MWDSLSLKEVVECASDPYPSIRKWAKDTGRKVIGSTLADVPEEVIAAFGFLPVTILGTHKPLKKASSYLPDNACSLARSNLELVLTYEGDIFDGYVLPQVCDTTQHLSDIWRRSFPDKFFESYLAPRQIDRPSAKYWVKEEIGRIIESMSTWSGKKVTDSDLEKSIAIHNENKKLIQEIYDFKKQYPASITNKELFMLMKLSQQVDKEEFNKTIKKVKEGLKPVPSEGYTNVILVGITCDPPEVFDLFDEIKLNIVGDTLITGSRYLQGTVPSNGNPIEALTERHFQRGFFSPIHDNVYRNFEETKKLYLATKAEGILYIHIEFCESQEYDLPDLKNMIKKEKFPMITLDTEYQTISLSHLRTRLQAFYESLKGGSL